MTNPAPDDAPDSKCTVHGDVLAGWRCHGDCKTLLCTQCTASLLGSFTCCACGGPAHRSSVARKSLSGLHWLGVAFTSPFTKGLPLFLAFLAVCSAVPFVTSLVEASPGQLASIATAVRAALMGVFVLFAVDGASRGYAVESGKPVRLARAVVATMWVWAPAVAYLYLVGAPHAAHEDAALLLFAALSLVYAPIALEVSTMDVSFGDVLDPFKMFELAWKLGRTYLASVVTVVVLGGVIAASAGPVMQSALHSVHTPFVRDLVGTAPTLALLAVLAHVIGLVTYVHGDTLGWGGTYREPLFPRMVATGRRKVMRSHDTPAEGSPTTTGSIPTTSAIPMAERAHLAKLVEAIKTDNLVRALRLFEERTWSPGAVDERNLIALSRAAARAKRYDLARQLLDEALAKDGRSAGQALLALAQLFGTMGDAARAKDTYRQVLEKYPNTDVAKVAARHVEAA